MVILDYYKNSGFSSFAKSLKRRKNFLSLQNDKNNILKRIENSIRADVLGSPKLSLIDPSENLWAQARAKVARQRHSAGAVKKRQLTTSASDEKKF